MIDAIHAALHGEARRDDGEFHAACPFCGKPAKPGQRHFAYGARGYYCFVCGASGGLRTLARHLRLSPGAAPEAREAPPPRPELPFIAEALIGCYIRRPERYARWRVYRGLTEETVRRFELGYGRLPGEDFAHSQDGLILPVRDARGRCRTLRQRTKRGWLTYGGKTLYAPLGLPAGALVIVVENCANCCLIAQAAPHLTPLAPTTGAASWDARWPRWIAARKPEMVTIAGDDDEAGARMNERWALAMEIAGVSVETEVWTEEREDELQRSVNEKA